MKKFGSWTEQVSSQFRTSSDNKVVTITPPATLAGASNSFTTPNITGTTDTVLSRVSVDQTTNRLQNKDLAANTVGFVDNTDTSKKLLFNLSGLTTATIRTLVVPNLDDTLVTLTASQALTNKTIDGDLNTVQDLALTSLKTTANLNVFLQRNGSGVAIDSAKTVPAGDVIGTSDSQVLTNKTIDADLNTLSNIENADIKAAAGIAYSKLNLATSIVNADISASAAIAYSKLNLATSIVNADVSASAAIAYSKLNLATSIVDADVATAAAIARSKLASGSNDHVIINSGTGVMTSEAQLAITRGGTGAATANTGFNALAPTTTKGDLVAHNGTINVRHAVGTDGQVLTANSANASGLGWSSPLTNPMDSEGDLIVGGVAGAATKLDSGTANYLLQANGAAAPSWVNSLAMGLGAVGTPSYSFGGDLNTGIWSSGADTVNLSTAGVEALRVDSSGRVGINATSLSAKLHVQGGNIALLLGADSNADTLTDATAKIARIGVPHYTNAATPAALITGASNSTDNTVNIGGGTSSFNAATVLGFYTAANNTTTAGTLRGSVSSAGAWTLGTSSGTQAHIANGTFSTTISSTGAAINTFENTNTGGSAVAAVRAKNNAGTVFADMQAQNNLVVIGSNSAHDTDLMVNGVGKIRLTTSTSSNRVMMGTTTARTDLNNASGGAHVLIEDVNSTARPLALVYTANNTTANIFTMVKARGTTAGSVTAVTTGDNLGVIQFEGTDGTHPVGSASINAVATGTISTGRVPGELHFYTADNAAGGTMRRRILISSDTNTVVQITGASGVNPQLQIVSAGTGVNTWALVSRGDASGNFELTDVTASSAVRFSIAKTSGQVTIGTSGSTQSHQVQGGMQVRSSTSGSGSTFECFYSGTSVMYNGAYTSVTSGENAANAVMKFRKDTTTGRSINSAGTNNASGADYAEYMTKDNLADVIAKGEVCGVKANGKLTKLFDEAISFVIKSTNPSYVGGDTWFTREQEENETEQDYLDAIEDARQSVDRIAFCGQVPCIVSGSFAPGDWIVPEDDNNDIIAVAVADSSITFAQYRKAIGQVWKDLGNGQALVIVGTK